MEEIGYYDPLKKDLKIDADKAAIWLKNGAQPTETVKTLLKRSGVK